MGFNLYLAGAEHLVMEKLPPSDCVGKLFTYAAGDKALNKFITNTVENEPNTNIFIDSGAFSVHHSGKFIDIDQYIEYINRTDGVTIWAELDTIPYPVLNTTTALNSSEESWRKYLYMMERVRESEQDKLVPVYHYGEPYEALERILNTEVNGRLAPYIAVGGRHGTSKADNERYFQKMFKIVENSRNPKVKIHAFGMTIMELLEKYPFYSADSTSWLMPGVNGCILTDCLGVVRVSEKSSSNDKNSYWNKPDSVKKLIKDEVEGYGYDINELSKEYRLRHLFNASYFIRWANNYKFKGKTGFKRKRLF